MVDNISNVDYQYPTANQSLTTSTGSYQIPSTYSNSVFQSNSLGLNNLGLTGLGNTGLNGLGIGFDFDNDIMAQNIDWNTICTSTNQTQQTTTPTSNFQTTTPQTTTATDSTEEEKSEGDSNIGKIGLTTVGLTVPTIIKAYESHKTKTPLKLFTKGHGVSSVCYGIAGLALGWIVDNIINSCKKKTTTTVATQN